MIGLNQRGEVKVWISCNPAFNQPDLPLHSSQEALTSLTQLILFTNPQIAAMLKSCHNIPETLEILSKVRQRGFSRIYSEGPIRRDSSAAFKNKKSSPSNFFRTQQPDNHNFTTYSSEEREARGNFSGQ